jgi:hypothetical protein
MAWFGEGGTFFVALVVLLLPGCAAALAVRLRGFTALAAAAPLSLAMLTAAALVNIVLPFRWNLWAWGIGTVLLIAVAFAMRVAIERLIARARIAPLVLERESLWREALPFVVVIVVAGFSITRLASAFGDPSNISQTFDNIYHLNAVRQMMDDGVIAPTRQLLPGFYPDLWHIVVSTVAQMSGAGVAVTVNVVSIVVAAIVWPISCIWLVRVIAGTHIGATITAGALSVGMAAFPMLMLDFGVLYPNVLSIALLPSAIAAAVFVSGIGRGARPDAVVRWALLVALVPTVALAHPSTLIAFLLPAFLIAFSGLLLWWRDDERGRRSSLRTWAVVVFLSAFVVAVIVFVVARPRRELAFWPPSASLSDAVIQVVSGGLVWRPAAWPVSAIAIVGILTILIASRWRRQWWLIASTAGMIILYLVCLSFPVSGLRFWLTGTWYQDIYRIAALFPTFLVPLGALGVVGVATISSRALPDGRPGRTISSTIGAAAGVLLLVLTQTGEALAVETRNTTAMYRQNAQSPLVTNDERELLSRLPGTVPANDVIVGSPWTGTSLSFALANRRALVLHIFQELTPDMTVITERLNRAYEDPDVCEALERTGTRWVLDFGDAEIHGGNNAYVGLTDLSSVAKLVDHEGDARLYEITACN